MATSSIFWSVLQSANVTCKLVFRIAPMAEKAVMKIEENSSFTDLDLITEFDFYLIARGFNRTFATGAACQQRTLTPPDTWSCPIWDLQVFS